MGRVKSSRLFEFAIVVLAACCPLVRAFPSNRHRVPNGFRVPCPEGHGKAEGCRDGICHGIGHRTCWGGDFPLNAFGEALKENGHEWTKKLCEADSDGDGLTNGEELGDPCCLWAGWDTPSDYMANFQPSNPADPKSKVPNYSRPSCSVTKPKEAAPKMGQFNEGEEVRSADCLVDNYQIRFPGAVSPRTDYVDIGWNFPVDSDELFHVVYAEPIIATPKNLHHYVVDACENKFPAHLNGKPIGRKDRDAANCWKSFGGWVPGRQIVSMPSWAGLEIGKPAKIQSFLVNIHYDNPDLEAGVISNDGMRIHYTPTLRKESLSFVSATQISYNPSMFIPPAKRRYFMTRRCKLTLKDKTGTDREARILTGSFHGHLLATEMYAERIRDGKALALASDPLWYFDDQYMDILYLKNITFKSGDILETTCIFDSRSRSDYTVIGVETTDEMCWSNFQMATGGLHSKCEGHVWTGSLDDTESGMGLQHRHPEETADGVWSGKSLRTGGDQISNNLEMDICNDMGALKQYCPYMSRMVSDCSKNFARQENFDKTSMKSIGSLFPLHVCCSDMCKAVCPEHSTCKKVEAASMPTNVDNKKTEASKTPGGPQSTVTTTTEATAAKAPARAEPEKSIQFITTVMTIKGLDFYKVSIDKKVREELETRIKESFLAHLPQDYSVENFVITLTKGSVKAQVDIIPLAGSDTASLKAHVLVGREEVEAELLKKVQAWPGVIDLLEAGKTAEDVTVDATAPIETTGLTAGVMPTSSGNGFAGAGSDAPASQGNRVGAGVMGLLTVVLVQTAL